MTLQLGDKAPDFTAKTTQGPIQFYSWLNHHWCLFFSYPKDFTSVCNAELAAVAKLKTEFDKLGVKVIGLSAQDVASHNQLSQTLSESEHCQVDFPIIGDTEFEIANLYGMVHPKILDNLTTRSAFIIDPQQSIRFIIHYPPNVPRDFKEILRILNLLQMAQKNKRS